MYSIKNDYWQETVNENWLENFTNTMIRIEKYYLKQNMYHDWTNYVHLHVISSQAKVSLFCLLEIQKANYRFKIKKIPEKKIIWNLYTWQNMSFWRRPFFLEVSFIRNFTFADRNVLTNLSPLFVKLRKQSFGWNCSDNWFRRRKLTINPLSFQISWA